jgi:5-methylcytosine-specific restriction endonuclease McrA
MRKPKVIHNFYKSDIWMVAREIKIRSVNGLCERCGSIGQEVHHKKRITVENVNDASVSVNPDNLELLCKDCHNKEHKRFSRPQQFDEVGNMISL